MDGKTHRRMGTFAGAVAGATAASDTDGLWEWFLALVGGAIGGNLGARMPDWIEPAVNPNHRHVAHSVAAGTAVVAFATKKARGWEAHCRARVAHFAALLEDSSLESVDRIRFTLARVFWGIAVGFPRGLAAGYASHLALDSQTPKRIPLLARGF